MKVLLSYKFAIGVLIVTHLSGVIGMQTAYADWFLAFTPLNLLLSCVLLLLHHPQWKKGFYIFIATCFLVGFGVEVLGVHTGWPFGDYSYGEVLGPKVFDVPLVIGVNWLLLIYSAGVIVSKIKLHWVIKALISAFLLMLLDFLIEPSAIELGFWQWEGVAVPHANYIAWFVVALLLSLLFHRSRFAKDNPVAGPFILIQVLFFGILNLL